MSTIYKKKSARAHYFGAGPAAIATTVINKAKKELLSWHDSGISILEFGHRTEEFQKLLLDTQNKIKSVLNIPDQYKIIFTGGNTRSLFATIPMNFYSQNAKAGYFISGLWSSMAYDHCINKNFAYKISDGSILPNTKYIYYTPNETVNGIYTKKNTLPTAPWIIADMTSCLFMEPINFSNYGIIFAGAQKNLGNAGLQIIICHEDLLTSINQQSNTVPKAFNLKVLSDANSLFATPPTFNIYLANLILDWMLTHGDINYWYEKNNIRAKKIYNLIDQSKIFYCPNQPEHRSNINICFKAHNAELEQLFIKEANMQQLIGLKGHSTNGGLRISLYNAVRDTSVKKFNIFFKNFCTKYE